jgi:hypothetical protein
MNQILDMSEIDGLFGSNVSKICRAALMMNLSTIPDIYLAIWSADAGREEVNSGSFR